MFRQKKTIKGREYTYLEHSFRTGKSIRKVSLYMPTNIGSINEFIALNKKVIDNVAQERTSYLSKKVKHAKFFGYGNQILFIEHAKVIYNVFFNKLPPVEQERIKDDFLRSFLVNSMAMEGGTISYDIAKAIDQNKRFDMRGISELDIPLYKQLRQAFFDLEKLRLRYPSQIRDLHKIIYQGIYPFAGEFRKKNVTFGNLDKLAITAEPDRIQEGYQKAIKEYTATKNRVYDFERIITFHQHIQGVHGFEDGNSRLGRLIMAEQFMSQGYPPPLIKGTQSRAYRMALVKAINEKDNTALLKLFYTAYKRTFSKFWLPRLEEAFKKSQNVVTEKRIK